MTGPDRAVETDTARVVWHEGILRIHLKPNAVVEVADCLEHEEAAQQLTGGIRAPVLVDSRVVHSVTRDARAYVSREEAAHRITAQALVVDTPVSRVIGNFFLGLNKAPFPTKLFSSEDEALAWLEQFKA